MLDLGHQRGPGVLRHAGQRLDGVRLVDAFADEQRGDEIVDGQTALGDETAHRRGPAQPSEATRLAGEVAVPALSPPEGDHRIFGMERVSLASFLGWCGLRW